MGLNPEVNVIFYGHPDGNTVTAANIVRNLRSSGVTTNLISHTTPSTLFATTINSGKAKNIAKLVASSSPDHHDGRDGVTMIAHSLNVMGDILIRNPHLLKEKSENKKTIFVQESALAALTYMPSLAHALFGDIYLYVPDVWGKTTGKFGQHNIARQLDATLLYFFGPAHKKAQEQGLKSLHVEPVLPGFSLKRTQEVMSLSPISPLLPHTFKESGTGLPKILKARLLHEHDIQARSYITPKHIETWVDTNRISRIKRPRISQLYEDLGSERISHFNFFPSENAQILLALAALGRTRLSVDFFPPKGRWERENMLAVLDTLQGIFTISALTWDESTQNIHRHMPAAIKKYSPSQVISQTKLSEALNLS